MVNQTWPIALSILAVVMMFCVQCARQRRRALRLIDEWLQREP